MRVIVIGYLGNKSVYLGLTVEDAKKRWLASHPEYADTFGVPCQTFECNDEFECYDAW